MSSQCTATCCCAYFGLAFGKSVLYFTFLSPVHAYYNFCLLFNRLKESKYKIQCPKVALKKNVCNYKCQIWCVKTGSSLVAYPNCKGAGQLCVC